MKTKIAYLSVLFFLTNLSWAHDMTETVLEDCHDLQTALGNDLFEGAQRVARLLKRDTEHWLPELSAEDPRRADVEKMLAGAKAILEVSVTEEQEIRNRYELVSAGAISLIRRSSELKSQWQLYYCPMVRKYWTQPKTDLEMLNPYMGTQMPHCGTKKPW